MPIPIRLALSSAPQRQITPSPQDQITPSRQDPVDLIQNLVFAAASSTGDVNEPAQTPTFMNLPREVRLKILRHLLHLETTITEERRWEPLTVREYKFHEGAADGSPPPLRSSRVMLPSGCGAIVHLNIDIGILQTCKKLYLEGQYILRVENKFCGIEGFGYEAGTDMDNGAEVLRIMKLFGDFPSWSVESISRRNFFVPDTPDCAILYRLPLMDVNTVMRISTTTITELQSPDLLLFPLRYLGVVCRAISYLPAIKDWVLNTRAQRPQLQVMFESSLKPKLLGLDKPKDLINVLSTCLAHPLGKWISEVYFSSNLAVKASNKAEISLVKEVRQLRHATPQSAVVHALMELVDALVYGDILLQGGPHGKTGMLFLSIKRMIFQLLTDERWQQLLNLKLRRRLELATAWACYCVAAQPILNEGYALQNVSLTNGTQHSLLAVDTNEALWMQLQIDNGAKRLFTILPTDVLIEWSARLELREAELKYMGGIRFSTVAGHLMAVAIDIEETRSGRDLDVALMQSIFNTLFHDPSMPAAPLAIQQDVDDFLQPGYNQVTWNRMRGGSIEDDKAMDRGAITTKLRLMKGAVEEQFGKVPKCPFDPRSLVHSSMWRED